MTSASPRAPSRRAERIFFSWMAVGIALVAFAGFARTYFLRALVDPQPAPPPLTPLIHLHAVLFTGWVLLLFAQVRLVAAGRIDLHRRLGVAGAGWAVLMIAVGTVTALHGVLRGVSPGGMDPYRFLVVPLFALLLFAVLLVAGIRARRDPATHKRLMVLATISLLPPALARWVIVYLGFGPPVVLAMVSLLVLPLVVWDLATSRRLHPATLWGGLIVILSGPLRLAIASTEAWVSFARWAVGLVQ